MIRVVLVYVDWLKDLFIYFFGLYFFFWLTRNVINVRIVGLWYSIRINKLSDCSNSDPLQFPDVYYLLHVFVSLSHLKTMQSVNGLGLQAVSGDDFCKVTLRFPSDTIPKWVCLQRRSSVISLLCSPFNLFKQYF